MCDKDRLKMGFLKPEIVVYTELKLFMLKITGWLLLSTRHQTAIQESDACEYTTV